MKMLGLIVALAAMVLTACGNDLGSMENPAVINPLEEVDTPFTVTIDDELGAGFWVSGGYLYYCDWPEARIQAVNLLDTEETLTALSMEEESIWEGELSNLGYSIGQRNGIGCFYISKEDAATGDYDYRLYGVNGVEKVLEPMELEETPFGEVSVVVEDEGDESCTGNLFLLTKDGKRIAIGDPGLHYLPASARWMRYDPSSQVYLAGEEVVLSACQPGGSDYELCCVNLKSGTHTTLWSPFYSVRVDGEYAYAIVPCDEDGDGTMLLKISIPDGTSQEVPLKEAGSMESGLFAVLSGMVYYQNGFDAGRPPLTAGPGANASEEGLKEFNRQLQAQYEEWSRRYIPDQELYRAGDEEQGSLLPGAEVMGIERHGDYIVSRFHNYQPEDGSDGITMMVFDQSGQAVYETTDGIGAYCVDGDTLVYSLYDSETRDWNRHTREIKVVNLN